MNSPSKSRIEVSRTVESQPNNGSISSSDLSIHTSTLDGDGENPWLVLGDSVAFKNSASNEENEQVGVKLKAPAQKLSHTYSNAIPNNTWTIGPCQATLVDTD